MRPAGQAMLLPGEATREDTRAHMVSGLMRSMGGVAALCLTALGACGGESSGGAQSCTLDEQCSGGRICDGGKCVQLPCESSGDCLNGDQACIDMSGARFCRCAMSSPSSHSIAT